MLILLRWLGRTSQIAALERNPDTVLSGGVSSNLGNYILAMCSQRL